MTQIQCKYNGGPLHGIEEWKDRSAFPVELEGGRYIVAGGHSIPTVGDPQPTNRFTIQWVAD